MSILGWLVGIVLLTWFVVTVVANIRALRTRLWKVLRHDVASLIPNWALFVRPRVEDMVLLRRDVLPDGTLTSWRELEVAGPHRWYNVIWNPGLGPRRALLALTDSAARSGSRYRQTTWPVPGQGSPSAIPDMLTVPYLALLKYVSERSDASVVSTQFMVLGVSGLALTGRFDPGATGRVMLMSEFHLVPERSAAGGGDDRGSFLDQLSA